MEDQNLNLPYTFSPSSTQNKSETTNNAAIMTEVEGNGVGPAGPDTGAKSKSVGSESAPVKRGRGRPRKYEVGGKPLSPVTPTPGLAIQPCGSEEKRGRGRPRGSGKLQILASIGGCVGETAGGTMSPHVLIVKPGEDIVGKIFAFYQKGPSIAVCILSATGTISSVTIRQPDASDGFLTYEGHFEILSLSGSCTFTSGAAGGAQRKIGMLSVSLAKPNGEVFGGGVENTLIAATPTQLILATFKQTISNQIKRKHSSLPSTAANMLTNQDSAKENNSKVPKLTTEGGPSCLTPTTTNTNGVIVEDNVTIVADENVQFDSIVINLDSQTLEPVKGEPSRLTATTTNTNGVIVEDNVTIVADENFQSDSIVIDLDSQTPEPVKGEPSCLTATTTNTNGVIVEDNVTNVADENVLSDSIVIDLDSQIPEPVKRSPDFDANHVPEE